MSAIVRKTYDTDSIVLRRIFVVDPTTNTRVSTNSVLVTGLNGTAAFQDGSVYLSTIGAPTSESLVSTVSGLGTLGYLSAGTAGDVTSGQLISTVTGLGNIYLSTGGGAGDVTVANLTSTTLGLGTLQYLSSSQLFSTVAGLGNIYLSTGGGTGDVTRENLTSTTLGLGSLSYLSSSQLISTVAGLGNLYLSTVDVTDSNLTSTTEGLGSLGYISTSQLVSTVANLLNTFSTVYNISSAGGVNISATTSGFFLDLTNANISTLINNNITINTSGGNVNDVDLTSTNRGLGTFGYISSLTLRESLQSTVTGLGTNGYLSTAVTKVIAGSNITISPENGQGIVTINSLGGSGGGSGDVTSTNLTSTTLGLGTLGYISVATLGFSLASTTANLARLGYVSSTALPSTVLGLSRFYVSTASLQTNLSSFSTGLTNNFFTRNLTVSTITADLLNISTISFGTGSGFITFPFLKAIYISSSSTQTDIAYVSKSISGAQLQFSSLEGDGSLLTNLTTGIQSTTLGLGTLGYLSSSQLLSTVIGLGSAGYFSTAVTKIIAGTNITLSPPEGEGIVTINATAASGSGEVTSTNLTSTTLGLGTLGYLSSSQLISTVTGLGNIYLSTGVNSLELTSTIEGLGTFQYLSSLNSSIFLSTVNLFVSTNPLTSLKNLYVESNAVGSYNPVRLIVSSLDISVPNDVYAEPQDIGTYYYFTLLTSETPQNQFLYIPDIPNENLNGWNITSKNDAGSAGQLNIKWTDNSEGRPFERPIASGIQIKIISNGSNYYFF